MTQIEWYLLEGINPEPWQAGQFASRGRGKKPIVYKSEKLSVYQKAVADEFRHRYPDTQPFAGDACSLTFCFWRSIESYELELGRHGQNAIADATNLQKACEDALQGILFANDQVVKHVESYVMAQGPAVEPAILLIFRRSAHQPREYTKARLAMSLKKQETNNIRKSDDIIF